jgi:alpha-L-arabinofuranosidase
MRITKEQKKKLDVLVYNWNDLLMDWLATDKKDDDIKKQKDEAYRLIEKYKAKLGLTDGDMLDFCIK